MKFQTAALIVPNNTFLQGDLNIGYSQTAIASSLKYNGFELKKISVVEENVDSVAHELTLFTKLYDIVLVLTNSSPFCVSQALANISSQELTQQIELKNTKYVFGKENSFIWPKSIKLLHPNCDVYPIIYFQRIFILTVGIVDLQLSFILKDHLGHYCKENVFSKLFHIVHLNGFKNYISSIQNENISISFVEDNDIESRKNCFKLFSKSFENIVEAEMLLREKLGSNMLSSRWIDTSCDMVYGSPDTHIKYSLEVIEKCLDVYGVQNVFLSFNGGKDCTVLLHLVQTVLEKKYPNQRNSLKLFCLYIRNQNAFREQDIFIEQCRLFFNLEVLTVDSNIKDALRFTLEKNPHYKACFMGTRRTDPFSFNLNAFEMTDPEWPQIMRCSPILDWFYSDVWDYLLFYKVPYCKLYDYGYTSLGNATNTIRNPNLLFSDGDKEIYLPAYKLLNEKNERIGRNISKI